MYVGVLGKNPKLSLEELKLVAPTDIEIKQRWVFFNTNHRKLLGQLGGLIKIGEIVDNTALTNPLVGSNDINWLKSLKKSKKIQRYKLVFPEHINQEIAKKGEEFLNTPFGRIKIFHWQPIELYQTIDFEKPLRGMEVGMMPAKLAHIMVNIARAQKNLLKDWTVYDPFVGFGTTWMIVNWLGWNFIGSDINISMAKVNFKRWQTTPFYQNAKITLFKHDVTKPFTKSFLKNIDTIVTEGWLGPSLRWKRMHSALIDSIFDKVKQVYTSFFENLNQFVVSLYPQKELWWVVSMPYYDFGREFKSMFETLTSTITFANFQRIDIYWRSSQRLKREIVKFLIFKHD